MLHAPNAHTNGDAMVWFPRSNVLHIGDILEVGAPPFIDLWSGGSLAGMLAAIDRVMAMTDERTSIVPGHGAVSSRADLAKYRVMLQTVGDRVRAPVAQGSVGRRGGGASIRRGSGRTRWVGSAARGSWCGSCTPTRARSA